MTSMPSRFSRATRLMRSMRFWITMNLGITSTSRIRISPIRQITAMAMIQVIDEDFCTAWITPPTAMMGA